MKKIALNLIMKNESEVIIRLCKSVLPIIDYYVIVDTGSTDNSKQIVKDFFDKHNIPGEIHDHPFVNYSDARNFALDKLKGKAEYGFWIDSDEELILKDGFDLEKFKSELSHHEIGLVQAVLAGIKYGRKSFFKVNEPLRWVGAVHELLISYNPDSKQLNVDCMEVCVHSKPDVTAESQKQKYLNHASILETEVLKNNLPRDVFYLAQSYRDASRPNEALFWYKKRVKMLNGFNEEIYYSQFYCGVLCEELKMPTDVCLEQYLLCSELDNLRAEHLLHIILLLQKNNRYHESYIFSKYAFEKFHKKNPHPSRVLFLDPGTYENKLMNCHLLDCGKTNQKFVSNEIQKVQEPGNAKILFKFATRSQPDKFFAGLHNIIDNLSNRINYEILVSADKNDKTMYNRSTLNLIAVFEKNYNVKVVWGKSKNKIDAINRDIELVKDWDILVNFSDDMEFQKEGFDNVIRNKFNNHFPDFDGCLHFNDGYRKDIITLSILGRKYYERFNYIYHPSYISVWCDNEQTEVAKLLNKYVYFDDVIFKHQHYANIGGIEGNKRAIEETNSFDKTDKKNFLERQSLEFGFLKQKDFSQNGEQKIIEKYFGDFAGTLLDIGANDGKTLSNTYACVLNGWKAVLVEPSVTAFNKLFEGHGVLDGIACLNVAISDTDGTAKFYESGTHLKKGDTSLLSTLAVGEIDRWKGTDNEFTETEVETITIKTLLKRTKQKKFDLISIDAEGVDYAILSQMDLKALACKMLIVETNGKDNLKYINYCQKFGMKLHHQNSENLIFVNE